MSFRPAYDEIVLEHGSNAVILRPSLRAASTLERSHDGFELLARRIDEFHTGTVREIIMTAATDRKDAAAFLAAMSRLPLRRYVEIAQASLARLCMGFFPEPEPGAKAASSTPIPLRALYRNLFRAATGMLGWSPDQAWSATPTDINEAFIGRFGEHEKQAQPDPEQASRNIADGLDPEFDRAGFNALKAKYGRKRR